MTTTGTPSTGKMLAIFLGTLLFGQAVLYAVGYFFPDIEMPSSIGIVFLLVAAMAAGQVFAKDAGRRMTGGEKLRFSVLATVAALVLTTAVLWGLFRYHGVPFTLENIVMAATGDAAPASEIATFLPIVLGVSVVVSVLFCFLGLGMGTRNHLKQMEKLAARGK